MHLKVGRNKNGNLKFVSDVLKQAGNCFLNNRPCLGTLRAITNKCFGQHTVSSSLSWDQLETFSPPELGAVFTGECVIFQTQFFLSTSRSTRMRVTHGCVVGERHEDDVILRTQMRVERRDVDVTSQQRPAVRGAHQLRRARLGDAQSNSVSSGISPRSSSSLRMLFWSRMYEARL